ncbi:hypothetical protein GNZ12_22825 [Paraburkholderia sp. 1N]|uniref:HlyD family secretion protein n=1 Tax=Paraburkholderia solitsugae TaxID=2675748 RepID=A0ABX2BVM1_9BURK|nr:hypothetical protein [Paraburkholderia solitsugae]NPT44088.1 hypothetical protein [Paraburkholderia solitsugae]
MLNFKNFQKTIISTYRLTMTSVLIIIVTGVLSYLSLMVFYALNRNWSAPIVLSPTQEKVLAYQPQVATLEATLLKNEVDLSTALQTYRVGGEQIAETQSLIARFDAAARNESKGLSKTGADIRKVLQQKRADTIETEQAVSDVRPMLASLDSELASGLITRNDAISRRLTIQSSLNAVTDSRINEVTLGEQARLASDAGKTLGMNGATSLEALQSLNSEAQLKIAQAQAIIGTETARRSVEQLRASVADGERVLEIARQSAYYQALTKPVPVVFVQYDNLSYAKQGAPVYDCYLQVVLCRRVGTITRVFDAEEYARHPLFKTDIKGKFAGVNFDDKKSSESSVVFLGRKPLLF